MTKFAIKRSIDKLGRVVIPKDMRNYYNINVGDTLEIIASDNGILIKITSEGESSSTANG